MHLHAWVPRRYPRMLSYSYNWQFYSFSVVKLSSTVRVKCALKGGSAFLGANLKCETHYSLQKACGFTSPSKLILPHCWYMHITLLQTTWMQFPVARRRDHPTYHLNDFLELAQKSKGEFTQHTSGRVFKGSSSRRGMRGRLWCANSKSSYSGMVKATAPEIHCCGCIQVPWPIGSDKPVLSMTL